MTFDYPLQQCWSCWIGVPGLAVQLVRGVGGRHLLLVGAGEVRDGGVAGALHPLLLLTVLPRGWRGGTLCPWRGGPALLKKINSYFEKHLDLTIKLSHLSFAAPNSRLERENAGICLPCLDHMEASLAEQAWL